MTSDSVTAGKSQEDPATDRGRRSRRLLLESAREVFEKQGYVDARISDIVALANMGQGSFYTYWTSKEHIFTELVRSLQNEQLHAVSLSSEVKDPFERIAEGNRRFIEKYRDNAKLIGTWEQVCTIQPEFREMRLELRTVAVSRLAADIRRLQEEGHADPMLDATCSAKALISMVTHFAYMWLALGEHEDLERANETLTRLWTNAIGLRNA